jgi:hypothetical protein
VTALVGVFPALMQGELLCSRKFAPGKSTKPGSFVMLPLPYHAGVEQEWSIK